MGNKKLKKLNRFTLGAFIVGLIIIFTNKANPKVAVAYVMLMTIYILISEMFDFHLWEDATARRKQTKNIEKGER